MKRNATYYLVREDVLPEALLKTVLVKDLLAKGQCATVHEAAEQAGISRSAFYKYKDGIFPLSSINRERIVTISLDLEHRAGVLSRVLSLVASFGGNVLTIHQSIPLQGRANVVLTVETGAGASPADTMVEAMKTVEGVSRAVVIGQG